MLIVNCDHDAAFGLSVFLCNPYKAEKSFVVYCQNFMILFSVNGLIKLGQVADTEYNCLSFICLIKAWYCIVKNVKL